MSDENRRALRTVAQAVITILLWLGAYLPGLLDQLGIDPVSIPGLALFVALLGVVARLSQSGVLDKALTVIGIGKDGQADQDGRHEA